jgi:hypothetical protein
LYGKLSANSFLAMPMSSQDMTVLEVLQPVLDVIGITPHSIMDHQGAKDIQHLNYQTATNDDQGAETLPTQFFLLDKHGKYAILLSLVLSSHVSRILGF